MHVISRGGGGILKVMSPPFPGLGLVHRRFEQHIKEKIGGFFLHQWRGGGTRDFSEQLQEAGAQKICEGSAV